MDGDWSDEAKDCPTLRGATITFSLPAGDNKDYDTTVDAVLTNNGSSIAQNLGFGYGQEWADPSSHSYPLATTPTAYADVVSSMRHLRLNWHPNGDDHCEFTWSVTLLFENQSSSQSLTITGNSSGVVAMDAGGSATFQF